MAMENLESAHKLIGALDLTRVMQRVQNVPPDKLDEAEKSYRHFLLMIWSNTLGPNGGKPLTPSFFADCVLHSHLLFTKDYAKMCEDLVGSFIHHTPDDNQLSKHHRAKRRDHTRTIDANIPTGLRFITETFLPAKRRMGPCVFGCDV